METLITAVFYVDLAPATSTERMTVLVVLPDLTGNKL